MACIGCSDDSTKGSVSSGSLINDVDLLRSSLLFQLIVESFSSSVAGDARFFIYLYPGYSTRNVGRDDSRLLDLVVGLRECKHGVIEDSKTVIL